MVRGGVNRGAAAGHDLSSISEYSLIKKPVVNTGFFIMFIWLLFMSNQVSELQQAVLATPPQKQHLSVLARERLNL